MNEKRKIYSKEFKQKAVELSNVRGNVQEIARELNVKAEFIYRWRREMASNPELAFGGNGKKQLTEEQKEIARLKRALANAEMERDIYEASHGLIGLQEKQAYGFNDYICEKVPTSIPVKIATRLRKVLPNIETIKKLIIRIGYKDADDMKSYKYATLEIDNLKITWK